MAYYKFILTIILLITLEIRSGKAQQNAEMSSCVCGESEEGISTRIVGGQETIPHKYPWAVLVLNQGYLYCGGTLINDRYVLTAGHCVRWANYADLTVALGVHNITEVQLKDIAELEQVILHENFTSNEIRDVNDLALLKLKNPVQMTANVKPICLPREGIDYTDAAVKVVGWGVTTRNGQISDVLKEATLKMMPFSTCLTTPTGEYLTPSMICAYRDDQDACQGDSGGPLVRQKEDSRYEIIGVVSWGLGCAEKDMPGVYAKVADYLNWIDTNSIDGIFCKDIQYPEETY